MNGAPKLLTLRECAEILSGERSESEVIDLVDELLELLAADLLDLYPRMPPDAAKNSALATVRAALAMRGPGGGGRGRGPRKPAPTPAPEAMPA